MTPGPPDGHRPPGILPNPRPGYPDAARPDYPGPIAFCGPGRTLAAALTLALAGETPAEIRETTHLPDPDAVYLVTPTAFTPLPPFDFGDPLR